MPGNYSKVTTVSTGGTILASDRNSEHDNHITNCTPAGVDDYSTNATQMQSTTDPYPAAAESLATSLAGEFEPIRYVIKQVSGEAQWYIDPDVTLVTLGVLSSLVGTSATQSAVPLGSVGAPSYSFTGDLNTGIYSSGANVLDFSTDGVNYLSIGATGIVVFNEGGVATADFRMEGDANANLFFLDASADAIGIKTSSPLTTFHVFTSGTAVVQVGSDTAPHVFIEGPNTA